ncbi:MAG: DUF2934 domain-containing protein [Bryobacterales bacterium]|nr:DUF2934 domain-containing protein [Bryobacterales bacterium]
MARKSNFESKPATTAASVPVSGAKKAKRTTTRGAAHRKASSTELEAESNADVAMDGSSAMSSDSISNLSRAVATDFNQDDVARLAYQYWETRGRQGGSAEEDWLRAERELFNR